MNLLRCFFHHQYMSLVVRKPAFCICENKTQISFAVTAKLISAFVFATWIVQSLFYQIKNFKPLAIFCGSTAWFVSDLVGNPKDRSSHNQAHIELHRRETNNGICTQWRLGSSLASNQSDQSSLSTRRTEIKFSTC